MPLLFLTPGESTLAAISQSKKAGAIQQFIESFADGITDAETQLSKLLDGSADLKDGVIDFNDEGISKITDLVNNDIDKYYDRLVAVRDYAKEYTTFAGANDGIDSSVKFIFKTEPVKR